MYQIWFCLQINMDCFFISHLFKTGLHSSKHTSIECEPFGNTRVYNLISVPQITLLLLGDATIASRTDSRSGSKKQK